MGSEYFGVTQEVRRMVNDELREGLMILAADETITDTYRFAFFNSRETTYGSSRRPHLEVQYTL